MKTFRLVTELNDFIIKVPSVSHLKSMLDMKFIEVERWFLNTSVITRVIELWLGSEEQFNKAFNTNI